MIRTICLYPRVQYGVVMSKSQAPTTTSLPEAVPCKLPASLDCKIRSFEAELLTRQRQPMIMAHPHGRQGCISAAAVTLVLAAAVSVSASSSSVDVTSSTDLEKCKALGFSGEARCSDCEALAQFVHGDTELVDECRQCCVWSSEDIKYVRAELQLCPSRYTSMAEIKWFVDKLAGNYDNLKVAFKNHVAPRLRLWKPDGGVDVLRVDNWSRHTFQEFMRDRVQPAAAA